MDNLRLVLVIAVVFSLAGLSASASNMSVFPGIKLARANPAPCPTHGVSGACSEYWYPAGPAMDTLSARIFTDSSSEYGCITAPTPCLDFPDVPIPPPPPDYAQTCLSSPSLYITAPIGGNSFCYPSGWTRVVNHDTLGLPNFFTWLSAWNPSPGTAGTIRQGLSQTSRSVNPYIATTTSDLDIVGKVYDSLYVSNPLSPVLQSIAWMSFSARQLPNNALTYIPPSGTVATFRFTLVPGLSFQDGRMGSAYDVAFSYLSMVGSKAFLASGASNMTGVTVLSPRQVDISVSSVGPFTLPNLSSLPIVPGRYWTNAGSSAWDTNITACGPSGCFVQYALSGSTVNCGPTFNCAGFPTSLMTVNPGYIVPTFDPIVNHTLIGSGPWQCGSGTTLGGPGCSSSSSQSPPIGGSITLTRFGAGLQPASSGSYFRSSGTLALCIWSNTCFYSFVRAFLELSFVSSCYGLPATPLDGVPSPNSCAHYQQGIGANGGPTVVGLTQIGIVSRFVSANWISPFDWQTNPPTGIAPFGGMSSQLVLHEGSITLNPASVAGCSTAYPTGGYDC